MLCAPVLLGACRDNASTGPFSSINPPFSLNGVQPASGDPAPMKDCSKPPAEPVKNLVLGNVYKRSDPTRSEIDPEAKEIYQAETKNLNVFQDKLSKSANDYLKSGGSDQNAARCAIDWLYDWSQGHALLGQMNVQGTYARQWALAGISSSYVQVRSFDYDASKKKAIDKWLDDVAAAVMSDYADIEKSIGRQNNHLYWAAWAVTSTGVATEQKDLYNWGVSRAKYALQVQIQDDGTLPLELTRGKKSLQYHIFALAPLVMISEAAMRNGEDLYELNDGALHRLVKLTFDNVQDPSYIQKLTGYEQIPGENISNMHFSWLEVYNARFPNPAYEAYLETRRPIFSPRTGGDMTFLYASGPKS
jgi:poly(beta-D-mannuronate) lyase